MAARVCLNTFPLFVAFAYRIFGTLALSSVRMRDVFLAPNLRRMLKFLVNSGIRVRIDRSMDQSTFRIRI